MSRSERKQYGAAFKAKVALEAIKGEETLASLSTKYGVGQTQISNWKAQALAGMQETFGKGRERVRQGDEAHIKELHAKIGQLPLEKDFLERASKVLLG